MQVGSEYKSGDIVDIGKSGSLCSARTIQTAQTLQTAHSRAGCSSEASEGNELVFSWKWLFCVVRHYRSIATAGITSALLLGMSFYLL